MKKMFYVLLALLVSMVLVFGVSCDNSNKTPGGAEDLGSDEVKIPIWANGSYDVKGSRPQSDEVIDIGTLTIKDGNFTIIVSIAGDMEISSRSNIKFIDTQTTDNTKKEYTLIAELDLSGTNTEPTGNLTKFIITQKDERIIEFDSDYALLGLLSKMPLTCIKNDIPE